MKGKNIEVTLTKEEFRLASQVGIDYTTDYLFRRSKETKGKDFEWYRDINGKIGEAAVHKTLGRYWNPYQDQGDFGSPDVLGTRIQVRSTGLHNGNLILRERDKEIDYFILVIVEPPVCTLVGWFPGGIGKKDMFLRKKTGTRLWYIPQDKLLPFPLPDNAYQPR